jgi:hypothetical protein
VWAGVALASILGLACTSFVEARRFERVDRIERVAVVPFYPSARLSRRASGEGLSAGDAAEHVTRFVSESLRSRVPLIPAGDMQRAFEAGGQVTPRQAPELAAMLAFSEFGADAVLLGEVHRYREREGSAVGSMRPASVEFVVTLHSAPAGTRIWTARFAHTQTSLTQDLFGTIQLPGRGARFLSAAELARFGADRVVEQLPLGR